MSLVSLKFISLIGNPVAVSALVLHFSMTCRLKQYCRLDAQENPEITNLQGPT